MKDIDLEQTLTANQLWRIYKDDGGTLKFKEWITREKAKKVFPLDVNLNGEVSDSLTSLNLSTMDKTTLGFPNKTLFIVGGVVVAALVIRHFMTKK
jgi:hypothetical protein